ncbi:MAG: hypothetical protein HY669_00620 [Chloroflexi bacterium]|nr:hypothetical protein [Chloroflexota bacterium]
MEQTAAKRATLPTTQAEALKRWPRLTAHMICESLGYFTPEAAANAILHYKEGVGNWCDWYVHMAQGFNEQKLLQVGRRVIESAFHVRHHHQGYMAHYPLARALVERVREGKSGPMLASWF